MPVKFEQNFMVRTTRNFELLERKKNQIFYNPIWQRIDAILEDVSG